MRRSRAQCSKGFTMLEMTTVFVILSILCAMSLSLYTVYVRHAESSRAILDLRSIQSLLVGRPGGPVACEASPPEVPRGEPARWMPSEGFEALGFNPGVHTRFQYAVEILDPAQRSFVIRARGDLDGDGETSLYELRSDSPDIRVVAGNE